MAGIYRQHHPERTVLYRLLFHYFDEFLSEYEQRFKREYGYFRPIVQEVVEKYLDCGNPKCGFARIRCGDCGTEFLLRFSAEQEDFAQAAMPSVWKSGASGCGSNCFLMYLTVRLYLPFSHLRNTSQSSTFSYLEYGY